MSNALATKTDVSNVPAKSPGLLAKMAAKYSVDPSRMLATLKATCFKGQVSDEQMVALMVVADQYGLNPFTKEIYAFPDKNNGIVPVIGVDGWIRIVNSNPDFQSMEFGYSEEVNEAGVPDWISCTITLKNRLQPLMIREYFAECVRNTGPWGSHPRRMLRHKAMIQCARLALGFVGIYDPDEAERVANAINVTPATASKKPKTEAPKARLKQDVESHAPALLSSLQASALVDKLNEEGIELSRFLAEFEIGSIGEILAEDYGAAMRTIDDLSADANAPE